MYTDLTSRVKWEANLSEQIFQTLLSSGKELAKEEFCPHHTTKGYNNPLLIEVEINRFTGALIGRIKIPHVTVADDLAFLTHLQMEMQFMLDCAGRNRYGIHPTRSYVLTYSNGHQGMQKATYTMGEDQVQQSNQTKHLGIFREASQKINTEKKVSLGRRTAYSLMGAGFHSLNG